MKKIFLFVIIFSTLLFSDNTININQSTMPFTVGPKSAYLVDKDNSLSINEVRSSDFTQYTKSIPNFGFSSHIYWFKFQFKYDEVMTSKNWWLSIDYPLLDYVTLFVYDNKGNLLTHKQNGDLNTENEVDIEHNSILFALPHNSLDKYTVYMKVQTSSSMLVPMFIMSNKTLVENIHFTQTLSSIYYGILLIIILYTGITFFYTRERIYALYVLFVIAYGFWQLSFDGLGTLYLWSDSHFMREKSTSLFIYSATFFLTLFSQTLLNAKINLPKYNKFVLQPSKYIALFGIVAVIIFPYKYTIIFGATLAIGVPIVLFIAGLMILKKEYSSVRFFILGWGIFLLGTLLFAMNKLNLIEGYIIMKYGQQIASSIEMLLLSGALIARFNSLRDEYTQKLKTHNLDLKNQVAFALEQERQKDQALIAQSRLASTGEMIEQIAHQWRQPLNNIGIINQDLYFKKQLGTLKDDDFIKFNTQVDENLAYMSNTIDDFRQYYRSSNDKETYYLNDSIDIILSILEATLNHYKINISVHAEKNIKVSNIKNQLFQVFINILNNAKDVLISNNVKDKKISITAYTQEKFAFVDIKDNGGGISQNIIKKVFDPYFTTKDENHGTGIGLNMSKSIIQNNMFGELSVKNVDEGACFTIKLPIAD